MPRSKENVLNFQQWCLFQYSRGVAAQFFCHGAKLEAIGRENLRKYCSVKQKLMKRLWKRIIIYHSDRKLLEEDRLSKFASIGDKCYGIELLIELLTRNGTNYTDKNSGREEHIPWWVFQYYSSDFTCSKCGPALSAKISLAALPRLKSRGEPATAVLPLKLKGWQKATAAEDLTHSFLETQPTVLKKSDI